MPTRTTNPTERPGDGTVPAPADPTSIPVPPGVALERENALIELIRIAAPSVATMSSYTAMQFTDKLLVSRIGPEPVFVAAQSNGGIVCWTLMTFCIGLTGVVSSFVAQNLGAGKPERGSAYAWNSVWIALSYWLAIMLPAILLVPAVFAHLHSDMPQLATLETRYAQIAMVGALFTLMGRGVHNYFFGLHRPGVVMVAVVFANAVNIFASMAMVFGAEGFPLGEAPENAWRVLWPVLEAVVDAAAWTAGALDIEPLGIAGAALGTVMANIVEFVLPMAVFLGPGMARQLGTRHAWRPNLACVKDLGRVGWPAGMMFLNEMVCWAMLMIWLIPWGGRARADATGLAEEGVRQAGLVANTAGWITLQWMHLAFMPTVGISIATQAMVGKALGAGRPDIAAARTWLSAKVGVAYMGLCAVAFVAFRHPLIGVFVNPETDEPSRARLLELGGWMLIGAGVFQVFDAVAIITSAALRGAGDTVWPGVATVVLSWTLIIGLGAGLVVVLPGLGAVGPWIGASFYISVLGVALLARFIGGRWKTLSLVKPDDPRRPAPVPQAGVLTNPGPGPDPPTHGLA